jgi:peptidyl-prolyl cis-trans isomerase B (cyclophilin B)
MKRFLYLAFAAGLLGTSPACAAEKNPVIVMETSMGNIKIELFADKAPITVKNFLTYVDEKFYDGTIFHRVIPSFMIQGGGFKPGLKEKDTHDPIKNEADNGLANQRGTIAMARTGNPNSATAQFFINVADNRKLDKKDDPKGIGYCVFGKVIEGIDVVDKIKAVKTHVVVPGVYEDVPVEDVIIKQVRRADK